MELFGSNHGGNSWCLIILVVLFLLQCLCGGNNVGPG
jgi:hypothetical protein